MQRAGKLLTVVLALLVTTSFFFLYRRLGASRPAPLLSIPDPRPIPAGQAGRRKETRRVPTVLSPDTAGYDVPATASGLDPELPDEPQTATEPLPLEPPFPSKIPGQLPLLDESLVPIPIPLGRRMSSPSVSSPGHLSDRGDRKLR